MAGIVLHHTAEEQILKTMEKNKLSIEDGYLDYNIPLQKGTAIHYVSNWTNKVYSKYRSDDLDMDVASVIELVKSNLESRLIKQRYTCSGETRVYIDNTSKFISFAVENLKKFYSTIEEEKLLTEEKF